MPKNIVEWLLVLSLCAVVGVFGLTMIVNDLAVPKTVAPPVAAAHRACVTMLKVAHTDAEIGTVLRTVVQPGNITCALALVEDTVSRPVFP